jgi:hypothetical protein
MQAVIPDRGVQLPIRFRIDVELSMSITGEKLVEGYGFIWPRLGQPHPAECQVGLHACSMEFILLCPCSSAAMALTSPSSSGVITSWANCPPGTLTVDLSVRKITDESARVDKLTM